MAKLVVTEEMRAKYHEIMMEHMDAMIQCDLFNKPDPGHVLDRIVEWLNNEYID